MGDIEFAGRKFWIVKLANSFPNGQQPSIDRLNSIDYLRFENKALSQILYGRPQE